MSEIEEEEYIRTTNGEIEKAVLIYDNRYMNEDGNMTHFDEIKAHSKNIIDLIEEDDYVNGHKVRRIDDKITIWIETGTNLYCGIYTKDIKTILTHEQYEQNCYKL